VPEYSVCVVSCNVLRLRSVVLK